MLLGSGIAVAVAVASIYSSDLTPSLGTSICHEYGPKKTKKKKKKKINDKVILIEETSAGGRLDGSS